MTSAKPRALIAWSSGKDSAFALHAIRQSGAYEVVGALTTVTETFSRVSMHGVRQELLLAQLAAAGLDPALVRIPYPCPNEVYQAEMGKAVAAAIEQGITYIVFGDLFLEDVRAYREKMLEGTGLTPLFPLWQKPTGPLAREMIASGFVAHLAVADLSKLPAAFAGRSFDQQLLADLPPGIDPCGENGEFHTFVSAGPVFSRPIPVQRGETVERDGFAFADFLPA